VRARNVQSFGRKIKFLVPRSVSNCGLRIIVDEVWLSSNCGAGLSDGVSDQVDADWVDSASVNKVKLNLNLIQNDPTTD